MADINDFSTIIEQTYKQSGKFAGQCLNWFDLPLGYFLNH